MRARLATSADAASIARIYNQGIEERTATFETALRSEDDILSWFDGAHPVVVVVDDDDTVIAFARSSEYSPRECYRGVFDFAVYTDRDHRRKGGGALAMRELVTQARAAGAWKLVSRLFVENEGSRALVAALGFREVGTYYRHAKLDGRWRDVTIVEKFLAPIGAEAALGPGPARAPREQILRALRSELLESRVHALEHARSLVETVGQPDAELLAAAADAFFMTKVHDAAARTRFVELFRAYCALCPEAAHDLYAAIFTRLDRRSVATDLDAFYEALYVVRQVARATSEGARAPELAAHVPRLSEWMRQAIELPHAMRTRISPGNVTSLLMSLALAGCESDEEKARVAELATHAKERHRVEPPVSLARPQGRASTMPPPLPRVHRSPPPPLPNLPKPPPLPLPRAPESEAEPILDLEELLVPDSVAAPAGMIPEITPADGGASTEARPAEVTADAGDAPARSESAGDPTAASARAGKKKQKATAGARKDSGSKTIRSRKKGGGGGGAGKKS